MAISIPQCQTAAQVETLPCPCAWTYLPGALTCLPEALIYSQEALLRQKTTAAWYDRLLAH